jgi:uncharacterized protein with ParB-like and HNH nuclease domain
MGYNDMTIQQIVSNITNNEVYLPAIQRRFVWTHEQIEKLFDSIMIGYPIGTFLFWSVKTSKANEYTFYKFIQDYHERDKYLNELAPKPETKERIIGVLDGQQRLSSLYLALQGSYAYKKPRARWDNDDAFPKRLLCFNILHLDNSGDNDSMTYQFKFLTEQEIQVKDEKHFWLPVKEALKWSNANDYIKFASQNGLISNAFAIDNLTTLWQRITQDKVINYYQITDNDLDSILEIFIRVNSGGTVLSKSDLLFSTIVANWEQAREEIELLLKNINNKGDKFNFDNDFIMRACLVLTDCPVLFKVNNFKRDNIIKIKDNWNEIKEAIKETVNILVEFGFNQDNLTSRNAVIPIAYHIYKNGTIDEKNKKLIKIYLITSLLKQIYGGKGERVLDIIRSTMRKRKNGCYDLKQQDFPLDTLIKTKLPADKSFSFTLDDVENLFEYKKSPYTFMVLSLLYPQLKLGQVKFHQDHLHPSDSFTNSKLKKEGIPEDKFKIWQLKKDTLANLQLLQGTENESKNKTPLKEWFDKSVKDKPSYKQSNYIPDIDLSLTEFETFLEMRKKLMTNELVEILDIK